MGHYLTALSTVDREIGRLEDQLRSSGRWPKTLLIVTADHGEAFGEHGVPYHGLLAYEAVSHVPGVIAGGMIQPRRIDAVAQPPRSAGDDAGRFWRRRAGGARTSAAAGCALRRARRRCIASWSCAAPPAQAARTPWPRSSTISSS